MCGFRRCRFYRLRAGLLGRLEEDAAALRRRRDVERLLSLLLLDDAEDDDDVDEDDEEDDVERLRLRRAGRSRSRSL